MDALLKALNKVASSNSNSSNYSARLSLRAHFAKQSPTRDVEIASQKALVMTDGLSKFTTSDTFFKYFTGGKDLTR